ncbi:MAG: LuxR C-terminal-related transcriptional regulator [Clostridia bacterium]|nr:LuxR C-terminal-related transcriptional regulator [Clostridia bacterium]
MVQETQLIKTKMNYPTLRSKLVKRPRLQEKLNGVLDYRLVLITAPAGFGKTTLLASWLNVIQKKGLMTAWVSLDEDDDNPELFWSYVGMSFYKINDEAKKVIETMTSFYPKSDPLCKRWISHLINDVSNQDTELIIILDDFHAVNDPAIMEGMRFLLKNMPPNMHMVISSRSVPDLGIARLRASDSVLEINQTDLNFTSEESQEFLTKVMGTDLPKEKLSYLKTEAEGWAAGLQIAALSIQNSQGTALDEKQFSNHRFVFEYLADEVFCRLDEEVKRFLLFSSVLEQFSAELCDDLMNTKNSRGMIEKIESMNLFLMGLDSEKTWFRLHNLFRNFLVSRLKTEYEGMEYQLYDKAAQWYECRQQVSKAVVNYIKAKKFEKAVQLIDKVSGEILCKGEAKLLHRWNQMLPENVVLNNSRLILNSAWAYCSEGKMDEVSSYIALIRKKLAKGNGHSQIVHRIEAEIIAITSTNLMGTYELDRIIDECKLALLYLEPKDFLAQLITFNLASACLLKGELDEAVRCFEKCCSISTDTGDDYITVTAGKALMTSRKWRGQYIFAEQEALQLISRLTKNYGSSFSATGLIYAGLAEVYHQWNELEKALEMVRKGLELGQSVGDGWTVCENYLMQARIYVSMGLEKEYTSTLKRLEVGVRENRLFDTRMNMEILRAETFIRKGVTEPVSKWLEEIVPLMGNGFLNIYHNIGLILVRLYICKRDFIKAREALDILHQTAKKYKLYGLEVEIFILSSMIYDLTGDLDITLNELYKAIKLSWHSKMLRVFLDEGIWMEEKIKKLKKHKGVEWEVGQVEYVQTLLNGFKADLKYKTTLTEELLSTREIEILQYIEQGATNADISKKLFLSINTVKTHLLNIYTKLDVHSRTGALAKARELNLI